MQNENTSRLVQNSRTRRWYLNVKTSIRPLGHGLYATIQVLWPASWCRHQTAQEPVSVAWASFIQALWSLEKPAFHLHDMNEARWHCTTGLWSSSFHCSQRGTGISFCFDKHVCWLLELTQGHQDKGVNKLHGEVLGHSGSGRASFQRTQGQGWRPAGLEPVLRHTWKRNPQKYLMTKSSIFYHP